MANLGKYASLLSDMDFNPAHFPHGTVEQFVDGLIENFQIQPASIRPLLQSHALVLNEHDGQAFRIAVSGAMDKESVNGLNAGCIAVKTLASVASMHEAIGIAADLRKYYLRHFPGRCHRNSSESNFDTFNPKIAHVYIAFFDKSIFPPRG